MGGLAVYREGGVIINIEQENNIKKIPTEFSLSQNYPNPFNPSTTIRFALPRYSPVELKVFDIRGREVKTLFQGRQSAGRYSVQWNGASFASGVYFYVFSSDHFHAAGKLLLLK